MRTAKSWCDVVYPAAHLGAEGELERQIKRVQDDAELSGYERGMREAAEIAVDCSHTTECKDSWSITRNMAFVEAKQAILSTLAKNKTNPQPCPSTAKE